MSENKRLMKVVVAALGFMMVMLAALYLYAQQPTLPSGFMIANWNVGGLSYNQFQEQWQQQLSALDQRKVVVESPAGTAPPAVLTLMQLGFRVDEREVMQFIDRLGSGSFFQRAMVRWQNRNKQLQLRGSFDEHVLQQAVDQQWQALQQQEPKSAVRRITLADTVAYEDEQVAYRVDIKQLQRAILAQIKAPGFELMTAITHPPSTELAVDLPLITLAPAVTLKELQAQGIDGVIASFSTLYASSGSGRIHNIRATAETIHDMLMAPGDLFDYSKVIAQTQARTSYQEAPVILNGQLVPGVGGGICQVSTTLYNAVLRAGLEVVERRNHSMPVSYVPMGQDATYADGYINFVFRNNTSSYVLIRTYTSGEQITVKLFGHVASKANYEIHSAIVQVIEPPIKYVHNPQLKPGEQALIQPGKQGYIVETTRSQIIAGEAIHSEQISRDTYPATPRLIAVHPSRSLPEGPSQTPDGKPGNPPIIEDGVSGPAF